MKPPERERGLSRREFLNRAGKTGLALAGAAGLGLGWYDSRPPRPGSQGLVSVPDFSVAGQRGRLAIVRGEDRALGLAAGIKALGGLENFVRPKETVLLKVNAAFASPPLVGATTHPELLAAMIGLCRAAGAGKVLVSDNPIQDPEACFSFSGLKRVCREKGATLLPPSLGGFAPYTQKDGRLLREWPILWEPLGLADRVIGLAPVKDHHRSGASLSMKNWYGLLGGERAAFHQEIHRAIMELALMIRPTLVVLDGVQTMIRNGPTGGSQSDLKNTGTMIVSTDQVAADAAACGLLGKTPDDLTFIGLAQKAGAGTADFESLKPILVKA